MSLLRTLKPFIHPPDTFVGGGGGVHLDSIICDKGGPRGDLQSLQFLLKVVGIREVEGLAFSNGLQELIEPLSDGVQQAGTIGEDRSGLRSFGPWLVDFWHHVEKSEGLLGILH